MYPTSLLSANVDWVPMIEVTLTDASCRAYDEHETMTAIQGLGCFFVNLLVDSQ